MNNQAHEIAVPVVEGTMQALHAGNTKQKQATKSNTANLISNAGTNPKATYNSIADYSHP
jgi:hypothetical protein